MGDRDRHEAGFGQSQGQIGVAAEPAAAAMGDDDERQVIASDRAVQGERLAKRGVRLLRHGRVARVPDADLERPVRRVRCRRALEADRAGLPCGEHNR